MSINMKINFDGNSENMYGGSLTRNDNVAEPQQGVGETADIEGRPS